MSLSQIRNEEASGLVLQPLAAKDRVVSSALKAGAEAPAAVPAARQSADVVTLSETAKAAAASAETAQVAQASRSGAQVPAASPGLAADVAPAVKPPLSTAKGVVGAGGSEGSQRSSRPGQPAVPAQAQQQPGPFTQVQLDEAIQAYGSSAGDANFNAAYDFNSDGRVDFNDLSTVLSNFGSAAPRKPEPLTQADLPGLLSAYGRRAGESGFETRFDVNGDGVIDFADLNSALTSLGANQQQAEDLQSFLGAYGQRTGQQGFDGRFDFDNDGHVGFGDLNRLLEQLFSA